jgi:hypothetical protein
MTGSGRAMQGRSCREGGRCPPPCELIARKKSELLRLLYPIERGLKSKNFIFRNFFKNDPINGNFMRKIDCAHFLSMKQLS